MAQVEQVTTEGLHWVREEIDGGLERVRGCVESYLETPDNPLPLQRALVELHQSRGTLRMIRCDGAALLAEEMKAAIQDLLDGVEDVPDKAFEVLLGATLQLTDYLDVLAEGERDNALVFLPLINELRVARGVAVLGESDLFARCAKLELPGEGAVDDRVRELAGRRLPAFDAALLPILKDRADAEHLERLSGIVEALSEAAGESRDGRLFAAAAASLEALRDEGAALGLEAKRLLGRVGQRLRALAAPGGTPPEAPVELLYALVYFAGVAASGGERVTALRREYRLDDLLPDTAALERLRGRLRGPDTGLVERLSAVIKEDIDSVKSGIDLVVRAGERAAVRLEDTAATARRVGDTLAMLGLETLQRVALNQARAIEELAEQGTRDPDAWMDVALALLHVEESLDGALLRHIRGRQEAFDPEAPARPYREIGTGADAVYREALVNLARVKVLIPEFIDGGDPELPAEAARLLHEAEAGMRMLGRDDGAALTARLHAFVAGDEMLDARGRPPRIQAVAEAVAALEYYLEALQAGQGEPRPAYERAAECVERLQPPDGEAGTAAADAPETPAGTVDAAAEEAAEEAAVAGEGEAGEGETDAGTEAGARPGGRGESELFRVFAGDARGHLERLRELAADAAEEPVTDELVRILHTLKGGAEAVPLHEIARLARLLEEYAGICNAAQRPFSPGDPALLDDAAAAFEAAIAAAAAGAGPDADAIEALAARAEAARAELPEETVASAEDRNLRLLFLEEARDLLEFFDTDLERWTEKPDDGGARDALMRTLHTLKGSARMAGVETVGDISHDLESRIAASGRAEPDLIERLRRAGEELGRLLDGLERGEAGAPAAAPEPETESEAGTVAGGEELEAESGDREEAAAAGESAEALETPVTFDERLYWRPGSEDEESRRGRPEETARVPVARLDEMLNEAGEVSIFRARLAEQNVELQAQLREMLQTAGRLREQLRKLDMETETQILARHEPSADRYETEFDPLEMDRYSALHELSRGLAESATDLISLHDSMSGLAERDESLLVQQSRVNTSLQQGLMRTLMVPFSRQSQRLQRLVRQLGEEYRREVRLQLEGADAELDRNVLERMVAPLEHLLRNAVFHGIEPPGERAGRGKPEAGTIAVRLFREGTQLVVEVGDDGRGLDFDAIRAKAAERGLLDADAGLADADLAQFIFEPGFSTARELTRTAGRGVGMDAVNAEIKQLGGTLTVDSTAGEGTRFTVRLPLTLAISQALLVQVGEERYAVPLGGIQGVTRIPRVELERHLEAAEPSFEYGGRMYRVRSLAALLNVPAVGGGLDDDGPANIPVMLVRSGERYTAFTVDAMPGSREIVVKPVGPQVATVPAVAGATIMAGGEVVLILDVAALMQMQVRRAMRDGGPAEAEAATVRDERPLAMVVDDSITIRRVSERFLSRHGFAVVTAKDGMDALAKLQLRPPDVVLLDIEMPRLDGYELATYMRNSETLRAIPIIMVTSRSGDKHRRRAETIGVERFVTKPYQERDLLAQVQAVLRGDDEREAGDG